MSNLVKSKSNYLGNPFCPDFSSPTTHLLYGYLCGASCDGRNARGMLGYGIDPLFCEAQNGLGFGLLSNFKLPFEMFSEIFYIIGKTVPVGYGIAIHYYNFKNSLVPLGANKISTIHDYVAYTLAGLQSPVMHSSDCASLGLYDYINHCWNSAELVKIGINCHTMPDITRKNMVIGAYKGIPISVAIGDNQASFLGSVKDKNSLLINIGTGSQISIIGNMSENQLEIRPLNNGDNLLVGCSLCGGSASAILKGMAESIFKLCNITPPPNLYELLNAAGTQSDFSLHCETTFRGTRKDSNLRGKIENITADNFNISNLVFAFLQGIASELYNFYMLSGKKAVNIVGSGNAIRKNPLLINILENTFKLKLNIPVESEEAAFGACLFALVLSNYYPDIDSASQIIKYKNIS